MEAKTLAERLRATHEGHDKRIEAERLYLDAYAGTGGFQGRAHLPTSSYWGWAADAYSGASVLRRIATGADSLDDSTYLDRHPREDGAKFLRRKRVVHYENHVAPCVDIPISYLRRKPLTRTGLTPPVEAWMANADGCGTSWDEMLMTTILLRGVVAGSCPVMFDLPAVPEAESADGAESALRTRAHDIAEGRTVKAIPLFSANVLDWSTDDDGGFEWVKLAWQRERRPDPLGLPECVTEVRILFPDRIDVYEIRTPEGEPETATRVGTYPHPFGDVPFVVFQPKSLGDCPVHGISLIHDIASEARRLFNLHSELDEHIRSTVFAFLQYPTKNAAKAELEIGAGSAIAIDPDSKQPLAYIAPPDSVAKTLETRIENTISAIYAMARLAFARGQQVSAAASGLSRAYEFESTNRAIADTAQALARFDALALDLVADVVDPALEAVTGEEIRTSPAVSYDVEELDKELATLETAARNRLGPTAMAELRKRVAKQLLPNTDPAIMATIESEIDTAANAEATAALQSDAMGSFGGPMDPNAPADPAVAAQPLDVIPPAAEGALSATAAKASLNGAQIASLLQLIRSISTGEIDKSTGQSLIASAFPLTEAQAAAIVSPIVVRASA